MQAVHRLPGREIGRKVAVFGPPAEVPKRRVSHIGVAAALVQVRPPGIVDGPTASTSKPLAARACAAVCALRGGVYDAAPNNRVLDPSEEGIGGLQPQNELELPAQLLSRGRAKALCPVVRLGWSPAVPASFLFSRKPAPARRKALGRPQRERRLLQHAPTRRLPRRLATRTHRAQLSGEHGGQHKRRRRRARRAARVHKQNFEFIC
jgi:hypothetical protein